MLHVVSARCVARDMETVRGAVRRLSKSRIAPFSAIIIIIIIIIIVHALCVCVCRRTGAHKHAYKCTCALCVCVCVWYCLGAVKSLITVSKILFNQPPSVCSRSLWTTVLQWGCGRPNPEAQASGSRRKKLRPFTIPMICFIVRSWWL